jgi:hypothetical protein
MNCLICKSVASDFYKDQKNGFSYLKCNKCGFCYLNPKFRLDSMAEKARYETHQNDIHDPRYQNFVKPLFSEITKRFTSAAMGLDFGCGEGPVLTHLLSQVGYKVDLYDPFFNNDLTAFERSYDYIFAIEVFEHLYNPENEIRRLKAMLKKQGALFIMTEFLEDDIDFATWYYRKDPTHVSFYSQKTCDFICEHYDFTTFTKLNHRIGMFTCS